MAAASGWHIEVDRDRCLATRMCVHALPRVFDIGDDGVAHVIGTVDGDDELFQHIVAECPTSALRLLRSDDRTDSTAAPSRQDTREKTF
jgi:ferredoxin